MKRLGRYDLSFFFIIFFALMLTMASIQSLALLPQADNSGPLHAGFLPQASSQPIWEKSSKDEPAPLRVVQILISAAICTLMKTRKHSNGYFPTPTSLPTDYRLFFLIPVFNSKYKDFPRHMH